jgi:ATP-dependent Lhr-like helicase
MIRRLSFWSSKLGISAQVRHGDTEAKTRRQQATHPPDVLVTTPETLQAILPGSRMMKHLSSVRYVVIDEVHELAADKRGAQLSVVLERLHDIVGQGFQRIGLSATIENPREIAKFIAGTHRPITIVEAALPKSYSFTIEYPTPIDLDYDLAERLRTSPEAVARINRILTLIRDHTSTLVFVNSRTNAEMLGHKLNQLTDDIAVHHGSLSREERSAVEDKFKANVLKALVCTSTMELGIDIGFVDLVVQYLSPRQVSSLIQRVGRSGHRLNLISRGVIVAAFGEDALESSAAVSRARRRQLEPVMIHENALDVAAHQTVGIVMDKRTTTIDEVLDCFHRAYPFRNLSKATLIEVVEYLRSLGELRLEGDAVKKARRTRDYYYRNLSMIPDERRYPIVDVLSDHKIGTLGDEFMALRARVGLNFICKGQVWRIVQIEEETGTVYVVPSEDRFAAIPGWDGEMLPLPMDLAREVGRLRAEIGEELRRGRSAEWTSEKLAKRLALEKGVLLESVREVEAFLKENLPLPTDRHILLEAFDKYIVVHSCFGEVVNRTLGSIFDAILSDHELMVGWWNDGYRVLVETPRAVDEKILRKVSRMLFTLAPEAVDKAFNDYVEARFPFAYKMKFVAERFGALPRGRTMNPDRMAELPSRFRKTPIYDETLREAMIEKVDVPAVKRIMQDIKKKRIRVSEIVRLKKPSPLAHHIFAKYSEIAELTTPESVIFSNIEKMKKTAQARTIRLLCFSCRHLTKETRVRELPDKPSCRKCGSGLLAELTYRQDADRVRTLLEKRQKDEGLSSEELGQLTYARRTADLILSYGKKAIIALQTRGVGPETASRILGKMHASEDDFYMDLLKAKIQYLRTKPFWEDKEKPLR